MIDESKWNAFTPEQWAAMTHKERMEAQGTPTRWVVAFLCVYIVIPALVVAAMVLFCQSN